MACEITSVPSFVTCLGTAPHQFAIWLGVSFPIIITLLFYSGILAAGTVFTLAKRSLKTKPDDYGRRFFLDLLTEAGGITDKLKRAIRATLALFDRIMGDGYFKRHGEHIHWQSLHPFSEHSPLTFKSFQTCLSLAILYPLIAVIVVYSFTDKGHFAIWNFSDSGASLSWRLATLGVFILFYWLGCLTRIQLERLRGSERKRDGLIAFAGAFAVAFAGAGTVAFTFIFAVAIVFGRMMARHLDQLSWRGRTVAILTLIGLLFVVPLSMRFTLDGGWKTFVTSYFELSVPLLFLPFINACFDRFSLGATRILLALHLKLDASAKRVVLIIADLIVAVLLVPLLLAVMIAVVQLLEGLGINTEINLHAIKVSLLTPGTSLEGYLETNAAYLWVFAMLFTTLVPTLIHFGFALCALATHSLYWLPALRQRIDRFVQERRFQLRTHPDGTAVEKDSWMSIWAPLLVAGAVCLTFWVLIPLYVLLNHLIATGLGSYGQLLIWVADLMMQTPTP